MSKISKGNKGRNKKEKKGFVKSFSSQVKRVILSDAEKEFLRLYGDEHYTPNQAASVYKCSVQYARRMRKQLIDKGAIDERNNHVSFFGTTPSQNRFPPSFPMELSAFKRWRIHGCEYAVRIIAGKREKRYQEALQNASILKIQGFTIRLYTNSLKIQDTNQYDSDDPAKAAWKAWDGLFHRLPSIERQLGLILMKDRVENIHRANAHFARVNDEGAVLAVSSTQKREPLRIYCAEDGKLRFTVDMSTGDPEAEFLHPKLGEGDAERYKELVKQTLEGEPILRDIRLIQTETMRQLQETQAQIGQLAVSMQAIAETLQALLPKKNEGTKLEVRPSYLG